MAPSEYRGQVRLQPLPSAGAVSWLPFLGAAGISRPPVPPVPPVFQASWQGHVGEVVCPLCCWWHHHKDSQTSSLWTGRWPWVTPSLPLVPTVINT